MNGTIQCENFGCLKILGDLLEEKLKKESNKRTVKQLREAYDLLPVYFRLHKKDPDGREHYDHRIRIHVKEIMDYVKNDQVKERTLREEMNNQFPIY